MCLVYFCGFYWLTMENCWLFDRIDGFNKHGKLYFKGAVYNGITIIWHRFTRPEMSVCHAASRIEKNGNRHDF